ncbi:MAG: SPFH domain-containing protein [Planctomycetota bacterium]
MSDDLDQNGLPPEQAAPDSAREASVTLRASGSRPTTTSEMMDQANQSLADALRFSYSAVIFVAAILGVIYVFSGVKTVREGEAGVKLLFGSRTSAAAIEPGVTFAWPYPFGELLKVETGTETTQVLRAFWGDTAPGADVTNPESVLRAQQLDPLVNGSTITADLNLAHTQWAADYRRTDPSQYIGALHPDHEQKLVEGVLERAVVHAIAEEPIESLLRPTSDGDGIERRVLTKAGRMFDQLGPLTDDGERTGLGIDVERVTLTQKIPPAILRERFRAVQSSVSEAARIQTDAQSKRAQQLNEVAGNAWPVLLGLIDEYEIAIESRDSGRAGLVLGIIDDVIEGRATQLDGEVIEGDLIGGEVTETIQLAENARYRTVEQAFARREIFRAKLEQFRANPGLMISRDWSEAYGAFLDKDFVTIMMLPTGRDSELRINEHPLAARALELRAKRREAEASAIEREQLRRDARFRTEEGIQEEDDPNTPGG